MKKVNYKEVVYLSKNECVQFPDFSFHYIGKGKEDLSIDKDLKNSSRSFVVSSLEFQVANSNEKEKVIWSPGYGENAPGEFVIAGKEYLLYVSSAIDPGDAVLVDELSFEQKNVLIQTRNAEANYDEGLPVIIIQFERNAFGIGQ